MREEVGEIEAEGLRSRLEPSESWGPSRSSGGFIEVGGVFLRLFRGSSLSRRSDPDPELWGSSSEESLEAVACLRCWTVEDGMVGNGVKGVKGFGQKGWPERIAVSTNR